PNRKRRGNLPKSVTSVLKNWLVQNAIHPYPTEDEKIKLAEATHLSLNQISNWFINARRRILQPI
ncbi:MAG: Homeodomain-like protein, partial [Podila humilis]